MSYFCFDTIKEEKENMIMESEPMTIEKKKRDHRGKLNPHFGHVLTQETKSKISKSQSERYDMIRKLVKKGMQQPMTEERVKQICNEVIDEFCKKNLIEVKEKNNKKPMNINL